MAKEKTELVALSRKDMVLLSCALDLCGAKGMDEHRARAKRLDAMFQKKCVRMRVASHFGVE